MRGYLVTTFVTNKVKGTLNTQLETFAANEKDKADYSVSINRFENDEWDIRSKVEVILP